MIALCGCGKEEKTTVAMSLDGKSTLKLDEQAGIMEVKTKGGVASIGGEETVTEADLKLPFYPASMEKKGASMKVKGTKGDIFMSVRETSDSVEQVSKFYAEKIKDFHTFAGSVTGTAYLTGKAEDGVKIAVQLARVDEKTMITINKSTK
jgi:hypothetical protein